MRTRAATPADLRIVQETRLNELKNLYRRAERQLQRQLTTGTVTAFEGVRMGAQLKQVKALLAAVNAESRVITRAAVGAAYEQGVVDGISGLRPLGVEANVADVSMGNRIHSDAVSVITDQMAIDLIEANRSIELNVRRFLRETQQRVLEERRVNDLLARGLIQGETRRVTSSKLAEQFQKRLADGKFVTVNGRHYTPEYYSELVTRTRTREAVTEGTLNAAGEYGIDLFQVSVHEGSCDMCLEWQGKVYSRSGADARFPALYRKPPFHPNCEHTLLPVTASYLERRGELEKLATFSRGKAIADGQTGYLAVVS